MSDLPSMVKLRRGLEGSKGEGGFLCDSEDDSAHEPLAVCLASSRNKKNANYITTSDTTGWRGAQQESNRTKIL